MEDIRVLKRICSLSNKEIARNFTFLGEGISRMVYSINENYVVKVAKIDDGSYQNKVENLVYTHASRHLLKYLCPIVYFQPDRIIMRKAIPLSSVIKKKYIDLRIIRPEKQAYYDLTKLTKDFILDAEDIISTSSWGIYNNQNVLIDYGCTSYAGDAYYSLLYNW